MIIDSVGAFAGEAPKLEIPADELKMAKSLTDTMTPEHFDLAGYRDDYTDRMLQFIQAKIEGQQVVALPAAETEEPQVINLMDALKKSLEKAKPTAGKPDKIAAPSSGTAKPTRKRKSS